MTKKKKPNKRAVSAAGVESVSTPCPGAICLADFEPLAKAKMPAMAWEYVAAGAGDEITTRWNQEAYQRIRLKPRVLVDVSKLDTRVTLFGQELAFPILLAPTAGHKLLQLDRGLAH